MKTNWILEQDTFEENLEKIKETFSKQGMKYQVCNNLPFSGKLSFEKQVPKIKDGSIYNQPPFFAYGSLQLIKRLQKSDLSVVTFCNFDQFKCSYYYPRFGSHLLQQEYAFIPYGELTRRKDWILTKIGRQGQVFVRPDDGFKSFSGQLVSVERWDRDIDLIGFYEIPPECMCVVAEPRNILNEYRFVIGTDYPYDDHPQRIISGSCYKRNGRLVDNPTDKVEENILEYVEAVLKDINYRPDPFWILDICSTQSKFVQKNHVLEVGSMSCAGLYGCDLTKVFNSLSNYLEAEWEEMGPPKPEPIKNYSFEDIIHQFQSKELNVDDWNFCISFANADNYQYGAFIMGTGAEDCLASRWGFSSEEEIQKLYNSLGVTERIQWI